MLMWILGWVGVFVARDWRAIPLLYVLMVGLSVSFAMLWEGDKADFGLAVQLWWQVVLNQSLWDLLWVAVAVVIWLIRRRRPVDD
jgi:hypothetical protein